MKVTASAPAKIIICGEHFVVHGTKAVLCAIDRRITVTAERFACDRPTISIMSDLADPLEARPGMPAGEIDPTLRPLYHLADRMMGRDGGGDAGIRVAVESDIPPGAGLGSSSACCVAAAAAISGLSAGASSREEILGLAIDAERTIFADTSGADCTVCTYGGIIEYGRGSGFSRVGRFDPALRLVVADSGITRSTERAVRKVGAFKRENAAEFSRLCDAESRLVEDVLGLIRGGGSIAELGQKITRNQEYLERIGVSNDTLAGMVRAGRESSFGAKITGAGAGGCVFAVADESGMGRVMEALAGTGCGRCFAAKVDNDGLILYN